MNLKNRLIGNLNYLGKEVFGSGYISETDIRNRLASISPYIRYDPKRLQTAVKALQIRPFIETSPGQYRFENTNIVLLRILSLAKLGPTFKGNYECSNRGYVTQVPPKLEDIAHLSPVIISNRVIFDEKVDCLSMFPWYIWKYHETAEILTSKDACRLHREIEQNRYRPTFNVCKDGTVQTKLPEIQAKSVGIRRNGRQAFAGVGKNIEIWNPESWNVELEVVQPLAKKLYS